MFSGTENINHSKELLETSCYIQLFNNRSVTTPDHNIVHLIQINLKSVRVQTHRLTGH